MRTFKRAGALAFLIVIFLAVPGLAATRRVDIGDNFYKPHVITVRAGQTITWIDNGKNPHSVTANTGQKDSFDSSPLCSASNTSGCMKKGDTFKHKFTQTGTFTYYCRIHGKPNDTKCPMCGTIKVEAAATPAPKAAASPTPTPTAAPANTPASTPQASVLAAVATPAPPGRTLPRSGAQVLAFLAAGMTIIAMGAAMLHSVSKEAR